MTAARRLVAAGLLALIAAPAAAAPPRMVGGRLSSPSPRSPDEIARRFVARDAGLMAGARSSDLVTGPVRRRADGALVEIGQVHRGVAVVGPGAAVRVDRSGQVRWVRSTLRSIPDDLPLVPRLSSSAAAAAAGAVGHQTAASQTGARLIIWAPTAAAAPRLAWRLTLPTSPRRLERWEVVVDATSGAVLGRRDLILRAAGHRARIYRHNPVATPDLVEVVLDRLPEGATVLADPDLTTSSCIDQETCEVIRGIAYHTCELEPLARASEAGDFLSIEMSADPLDPADAFSELSVYAHAAEAYAYFRELTGDPDFTITGGQLGAVANMKDPGEVCDDGAPVEGSALAPFDNAIFEPFNPIDGTGPTVYFGQGSTIDFGIDGEVVYHELGHGLVTTLAPELGWTLHHPHGIDVTPGGLTEGLPDYLAATLSGSSRLFEYLDTAAPIGRDLANQRTCPADLQGFQHSDGLIVSGALWEVRGALSEGDQAAFDRAVVTAIDALGVDAGFTTFQAAVVAEVELTLGAATAAAARAVFAARGLDGCAGLVRQLGPADVHEALQIGNSVGAEDFVGAAPVQFRVVLAQEAASLTVELAGAVGMPELAVKPGDQPIEWTDGQPEAGLRVESLSPSTDDAGNPLNEALVGGPFPPGVYHLQFLAPEGSFAILQGISIRPSDDVPPGTAGPADAGPSAGADAGPGASASRDDGGCQAGGGASTGGTTDTGLLLLLTTAFALRARRDLRRVSSSRARTTAESR